MDSQARSTELILTPFGEQLSRLIGAGPDGEPWGFDGPALATLQTALRALQPAQRLGARLSLVQLARRVQGLGCPTAARQLLDLVASSRPQPRRSHGAGIDLVGEAQTQATSISQRPLWDSNQPFDSGETR